MFFYYNVLSKYQIQSSEAFQITAQGDQNYYISCSDYMLEWVFRSVALTPKNLSLLICTFVQRVTSYEATLAAEERDMKKCNELCLLQRKQVQQVYQKSYLAEP